MYQGLMSSLDSCTVSTTRYDQVVRHVLGGDSIRRVQAVVERTRSCRNKNRVEPGTKVKMHDRRSEINKCGKSRPTRNIGRSSDQPGGVRIHHAAISPHTGGPFEAQEGGRGVKDPDCDGRPPASTAVVSLAPVRAVSLLTLSSTKFAASRLNHNNQHALHFIGISILSLRNHCSFTFHFDSMFGSHLFLFV